jgi:cytidine deaminase
MSLEVTKFDLLRDQARAAAARAYCPYSRFRVGAAILGRSGTAYTGCNVENASYGLSSCAERNAAFQLVCAGETSFDAIVIYTPTPTPTAPCGACRQVLNEFNPGAVVLSVCDGPDEMRATVHELLPVAFGPGTLTGIG